MADSFTFLGQGYDTFAEVRKEALLEVKTKPSGGSNYFQIHVCESEEDIFKSLDVKASLGVSYKGFDLDAKASYASELSAKKNTVTVLAVARKTRVGEVVSSRFLETHTSIVKLFQRGGDSYIKHVEEGGFYAASYQFESSSKEQKTNIAVECRAKFKSTVEASVNVDITQIEKSNKTTSTFTQRNFGGSSLATGPDNIYEFGIKFIETALEAPFLVTYETASYLTVKDCPEGFEKIAEYTKAYKDVYYDEYNHSLAAINRQADIAKAKTEAVKDLYQFYGIGGPLMGGINGHLQKIATLKLSIKKFRDAFKPDAVPDPHQFNPKLDLSSLDTPKVTFDFMPGAWAGAESDIRWKTWEGGDYWIYNFVFPKRISAFAGKLFMSVKIDYAKRDPQNESKDIDMVTAEHKCYGDLGAIDLDTVANIGPGEANKVGAWWKTIRDVSNFERKIISGLYIERYRNGEITPYKIVGREGADGGGAQSVDKNHDTSFIGFDGCNGYIILPAPSGQLLGGVSSMCIIGIRPVFVKFAHGWQTPRIPDEY